MHKLKEDYLGKKVNIAHFDLYKDKTSGFVYILKRGGKGEAIQTWVNLKD